MQLKNVTSVYLVLFIVCRQFTIQAPLVALRLADKTLGVIMIKMLIFEHFVLFNGASDDTFCTTLKNQMYFSVSLCIITKANEVGVV